MRKALATVGLVLATSAGAFALGHVTDKPTVQVNNLRDIRTDEPVACGLSEDSYLVDCRTGERLDYRGNGWWPTGDYANR